jgi:RNA polymerase sigma factor (sigma-70 family)
VAAGDREALAVAYRHWFGLMYAEARRATGRDESFCLDVVQDAMMRLIRTMRPIDGHAELRRRLRVVVRSCACDLLRAEWRRRRRERRRARAEAQDPPDRGVQPCHRWLGEQLAWLDERSCAILHMRYRLGWTLARIGLALGAKPGAVHGRLMRVLESLRRRAEIIEDE